MAKKFRVTLKRSLIGCSLKQKETVRCLGLKRRHQEVVVNDHPAVRGQLMKVQHLVEVKLEN
jgi:large subunit ribosomal protein L30